MTINFLSLMLVWLLPLPSGQNNTASHVTTGTQVTQDQLTTREPSSLDPVSEVVQENGTRPSDEPLPQTTSTMFPPGIPTATPTNSTWSQFNGSTEGVKSTTDFNFTTSAARVITSHAGDPTTTTWTPPTPSSSAQTQSTNQAPTRPSTRTTPSTSLVSTANASTQPAENTTANASPVTATQSPTLHRTPKPTTKTPSVHVATKERRPGGKEEPAKGSNHSKAVAGIIGGALVVMMVGFLLIYIKKRKLQKQQITTGDWAGPSPFLEGGANNGQVTMRPSNRISLSSFLTQRLSRRLSTLPDAGEELEDLTPASTFGGEHKGSLFGREAGGSDGGGSDGGGSDGGGSNGTAGDVPQRKSNGDAPTETPENFVSLTNEMPRTNNSEANHIQDLSANPPTPPAQPPVN